MNTVPTTPTVQSLARAISSSIVSQSHSTDTFILDLSTGESLGQFYAFPIRQRAPTLELTFHPERIGLLSTILEATLPALLDPEDNTDTVLAYRYLPYLRVLSLTVISRGTL